MLDQSFSIVRLFILGLLSTESRHGYDLVAVADRWAVHRWGGFSIGSIYHSLGRLAREGHVAQGKSEKPGNRPERLVWEITSQGRELAQSYVRYGLASLNFEAREVDMALAFAHLLSAHDRVSQLKLRLGPLAERLEQLRSFDQSYQECDTPGVGDAEYRRLKHEHPWIHSSIQHGLGRLEVEYAWTLQLIDDVAAWQPSGANAAVSK